MKNPLKFRYWRISLPPPFLAFFLLVASSVAWSSSYTVLNSFQSSTPALAAEVNENFQALLDVVNAQLMAIALLQSDLGSANAEISTQQASRASAEAEMRALVTQCSDQNVAKTAARLAPTERNRTECGLLGPLVRFRGLPARLRIPLEIRK
ncbi:MAG: hypothetical protein KKC01_03400 [Gammaproteobacteria bacterium]|nr:hypothetical protein [Gammaproteobacteria bacterium]